MPRVFFKMPRVFFQVSTGEFRGAAGATTFFALDLTWGGKVSMCGRDDFFLHMILDRKSGDLRT